MRALRHQTTHKYDNGGVFQPGVDHWLAVSSLPSQREIQILSGEYCIEQPAFNVQASDCGVTVREQRLINKRTASHATRAEDLP